MSLASPRKTDKDAASELGQVIARSRQGDVRAFRRLVESYQRYAYTLAFRIVCDDDNAREIVQDAFLRVWKNIKNFNPEVKFTTWLYKIVVNLSYDKLKGERRRRRFFLALSTSPETASRDSMAPDREAVNKDLADKIKAVAEGLPLKQRMVFVLRDLQDLTVEEVAEILKMSSGSVKTNLCFARQHIRRQLKQMEVEG
jgi:RNA polymerase sigma-70 factor (ECF subfamily)